ALSLVGSDAVARRARLVGVALATKPGRGCYVPLGHTGEAAQLGMAETLELLRPLLADPHVPKLFCDEKAARTVLSGLGLDAVS
ncbi:hypothetical protein, partial [Staphylococcus aureus]